MPLKLVSSWNDSDTALLLQQASNRYMNLLGNTFQKFLGEQSIEATEISGRLGMKYETPVLIITAVHPECDELTCSKMFGAYNRARTYVSTAMFEERVAPSLMWRDVVIIDPEFTPLFPSRASKSPHSSHLSLVEFQA